jgi:endonuclease/exonuclease/phosphatase family metal-dependent hydrolase
MRTAATVAVLLAACSAAHAQWNPSAGEWGKTDPTDLRVMTWNVQDGICSTTPRKTNAFNDWNAIVRIIAALQPDVLILQETGDNSGNGTGSGVDSPSALLATISLLFEGGNDNFNGGTPVTSYVTLFTPDYNLPYRYVSTTSDGFNRNVILSRFPFADVNGDGADRFSNFVLTPDAWQGGGNGGIRGFMWTEIDLPDETYAGDLVVGNSHLKAGGTSADFNERVDAAQNISYFLQYYYNGNGTALSDPNGKVAVPSSGTVLDANTPIVWGGDWNNQPTTKGPAEWMIQAQTAGGTTDGTDRDGTDCERDNASHPITGETGTQGSSSKLDYIAWQDSIATKRRSFVFRSNISTAALPAPVDTFPTAPTGASNAASDHRPVIVDLILPLADTPDCPADVNGDGLVDFGDVGTFIAAFSLLDTVADINGDGLIDFGDVGAFVTAFSGGC